MPIRAYLQFYKDVLNFVTKNILIKDGFSQVIHSEKEFRKWGYLPNKRD